MTYQYLGIPGSSYDPAKVVNGPFGPTVVVTVDMDKMRKEAPWFFADEPKPTPEPVWDDGPHTFTISLRGRVIFE